VPPDLTLEAWRKLHAGEVAPDFAVATVPLPLDSGYGEVRVALGPDRAPQLLVPTATGRRVQLDLSGPSIRVRNTHYVVGGRAQNFIELESSVRLLDDAFAQLVDAVLHKLENGLAPEAAVSGAIIELRELVRRERMLDPAFQTGLFGELILLRDLVRLNPLAVRAWTGALGQRYDFSARRVALEVKTTLSRARTRIAISSVAQLADPPDGRDLYLTCVSAERSGQGGATLAELLEEISSLCADPGQIDTAMRSLGFEDWRSEPALRAERFAVVSSTIYRVSAGFPRITEQGFPGGRLPAGVAELSYEIDAGSLTRFRVAEPDVAYVLQSLAGSE
jgi:hypothetical protein